MLRDLTSCAHARRVHAWSTGRRCHSASRTTAGFDPAGYTGVGWDCRDCASGRLS